MVTLDYAFGNFLHEDVFHHCSKCSHGRALAVYRSTEAREVLLWCCRKCGSVDFNYPEPRAAIGQKVQLFLSNFSRRELEQFQSDPNFAKQWQQAGGAENVQKISSDTVLLSVLNTLEPFVNDQYVPPIKLIKSTLLLSTHRDVAAVGQVAVYAKTLADQALKEDLGQKEFLDPNKFEAGLTTSIYKALGYSDIPALSSAAKLQTCFRGLVKAFGATAPAVTATSDLAGASAAFEILQDLLKADIKTIITTGAACAITCAMGVPITPPVVSALRGIAKYLLSEAEGQEEKPQENAKLLDVDHRSSLLNEKTIKPSFSPESEELSTIKLSSEDDLVSSPINDYSVREKIRSTSLQRRQGAR